MFLDMDTIYTIFNLFCIWLFWKWMEDAEENEQPYVAFMYLCFSAWNGAAIGLRYL